MPLSAEEQELVDWLKSSIPRWLRMETTEQEIWGAVAKGLILVRRQAEEGRDATFILSSTGTFLDLHARDRGTSRQLNESDITLRARLRTYDDAVTRPTILAAVTAVLEAEAIVIDPAIVELRRDKAFFLTRAPLGGAGVTFTKVGNVMTLDTGVALAGYEANPLARTVTIAGATSSGNNGTFTVTNITTNDQLVYTNASGVAEVVAPPAGTWRMESNLSVRKDAYLSRGYRMSQTSISAFIIILPYGATAGTQAGVVEALRKKKAAGFKVIIERRTSP